jgi:DNA-directed RNA polymerase specialized sigma24 family protein
VAQAKRHVLLSAYRHMCRREDLEDCYSQATLELIAQVRRGRAFASKLHAANTLELRFLSRIRDLRRAVSGRSPMRAALAAAVQIDACRQPELAVIDPRADLESLVIRRSELRSVGLAAKRLSADQRLVLAHQLNGGSCAAFCRRFGWTAEKYRKVAQRGRARLREVLDGAPGVSRGQARGGAGAEGNL